MNAVTLNFRSIELSDKQFYQLCADNRDLRFERSKDGQFLPLCPDFVIELRSPTDNLSTLQNKMQEYLNNGIVLGWLIDPQDKQVEIYRQGQPVEVQDSPDWLSGEDILFGFVLDLKAII